MPTEIATPGPDPVGRLSSAAGAFVEFSVVNYQFPSRIPDDDHDYDANWLVIRFRVSDGHRVWNTLDPAWLTWDLTSLMRWLTQVAAGTKPSTAWTALEPLLTLDCVAAAPTPHLVARLALELRSPDVKASGAWDQAVILTPTVDDLLQAAEALDTSLERFPPR